ncbi:MAG: hypothetical protein GTO02_12625, partial [Candidatus Dadabacteria bacterium]|nr:hypothetical protein [Candidatus Dadabacteria bacterium]
KTTENVSSLIEYQVKNLRQEILELNTTINDFKDKKDRSRKLAKQVNKLVVSI